MTHYHVRYATLDDIPNIESVFERSYTERIEAGKLPAKKSNILKTKDEFQQLLVEQLSNASLPPALLVLEEKSKPADDIPEVTGFLFYSQISKTTVHIDMVNTLYASRRAKKKRAKRLVAYLEQIMRDNKQSIITLDADDHALKAYQRMGFTSTKGIDLSMRKNLNSSHPLILD